MDLQPALTGVPGQTSEILAFDPGTRTLWVAGIRGLALLELAGRTLVFVGLEPTTTAAVAIFDITDPLNVAYLDMIVANGDLSPEGLAAYVMDGKYYLAFSNEVSATTTVYSLQPVPEPEAYAMMLAGLGLVGWWLRRRKA